MISFEKNWLEIDEEGINKYKAGYIYILFSQVSSSFNKQTRVFNLR